MVQRMKVGRLEFRPGLWPTLATLVIFPALLWLGTWQLERAVWKQGLIDANATRAQLPAVALDSLGTDFPGARYRKVIVSGRYRIDRQLLLDNRMHDGHPGYEVLTPLQLADGRMLLVNRGWVPAVPDRSVLPAVDGPAAVQTLTATIDLPPEKTFRLADVEEAGQGWPRVIEQLQPAQLERLLGRPLMPVILLLDPDEPNGFVRDWKPVYGVTPDKHRAYAMQWFTLALVLMIIYFSVNTHRIDTNRTEQ
jgi:surfeit locus 1 family protein